jgi:hypothetical protein
MAASQECTGSRLTACTLALLLLLLAALAAPAQASSTAENRAGEKSAQNAELLLSPTPQLLELQWGNAPPRRYDASGDSFATNPGAASGQSYASGSEWYDYFVEQYGAENVEWLSGSGRTIEWPSELPRPATSQMFRVRPERGSSATFARELESVAGPRPDGAVAHHNQPLGLNGADNGATNGSWQFNPAHQNGHNVINGQVNQLPYGTEIRVLPGAN